MLEKIKWIHIEPTTRCNAWCSGCARNNNGFGLSRDLKIEDLEPKKIKEILDESPLLEHVIFCGNKGDPCASKLIDEQLDVIFKHKKITLQLQTNGSLRNEDWWRQLSSKWGERIEVWFGLDGLKDTHSYYRQGTNFEKIISNAKSFIKSNPKSKAVWQFIPFAHNEHQIKDCLKMSQQLGFKEFRFIKSARYTKQSFHYKTGESLDIRPWSKHQETWYRKNNGFLNTITNKNVIKKEVKKTDCVHMIFPSVFLDAHGILRPCCFLKNTNLHDVDIANDFRNRSWMPSCLNTCGS